MKKITLIGVNYYPEDSAIGLYTTQKAEYLLKKGFDVSVITGYPYYPQWSIQKAYKDKKNYHQEIINGIKVYRYKQYVPSDPTFFKRIRHLLSFTIGSFFNLNKPPKPDIVIAIVPFTADVLLGWILKLRYKSKLWVHIQDFEFDAAVESGLIKGKKAYIFKLLFSFERFLLKRADVVSTISNGMIAKLESKTNKKGFYLTNWLDTDMFLNKFKKPHPYLSSTKFKILYSGNIGAKQDWHFFINFIDQIKDLDVEVVVVGEGAEATNLKNKLEKYTFVKHYNLVPFNELFHLLQSADLHVLFQKEDVVDTVMPSKILGMMGSEKPSVITGNNNSEVKEIIEKSKAGFYFNPSQLDAIVACVIKLKNNTELSKQIGVNAKKYIIDNYSQKTVLDQFIHKLNQL